MNTKGESFVSKVLLAVALFFTVLIGVQGVCLGVFTLSLFGLAGSDLIRRGLYFVTGFSTIAVGIVFLVKIYFKK